MQEQTNQPIIIKAPLSATDIKFLEGKLLENIAMVKKASLTTWILGILALFLPVDIWNILILPDLMANNVSEVTEPMYQQTEAVIIFLILAVGTPLLTYYAFVYAIKKDLKLKEKLNGTFQVKRIENISKRVAEKLEGLDTILHFEKNEFKINRHLFNKKLKPELLEAQVVLIELAEHSRIVLKQEIKS